MTISRWLRSAMAFATLVVGGGCGASVATPRGSSIPLDAAADVSDPIDATVADATSVEDAWDDRRDGDALVSPGFDARGGDDASFTEASVPSDAATLNDAPSDRAEPASDAGAPIDSSSTLESGAETRVGCQALAGSACVRCCADKNSNGRGELELVTVDCHCASCDATCQAQQCNRTMAPQLPQTPCIACYKQSILTKCSENGYLTRFCGDADCMAYVACLMQCPD